MRTVRQLPQTMEAKVVGRQVLRSGTSVGANIEEAYNGLSKKDFTHSMNIARKEARETEYWLRLLKASELLEGDGVGPLLKESNELARILSSIVKKSRGLGLWLVFTFNILHFTCAPASAALTGAVAQVRDAAGTPRTSFSSTERITLFAQVQNTVAGSASVQFSFEVKDPLGSRRLFQSGNSAPGSVVGAAGASLRGIPVSQFYTTPGVYTLVIKATSGSESVEASAPFTVLSPVITLTYPPNGARDLIDQPLTFRWVSSGATRYRIFVDDDSSFYNALLTGESVSNFFTYPQNPSDVRQRLAGGQTYYWKVEGLDFTGNVIARTDLPFSFTVKAEAAQATSKDLAIVSIERVNEALPGGAGAMPLGVFVKNQGGRAETNVPVNMFADGAAVPSSPKRINQIDPGKTERLVFPVRAPEPGKFVLVNAILDFFDDNLQNNSLSKQIRGEEREKRRLKPTEIWDIVRRFVTDVQILSELEGYTPAEASVDGLSDEDLAGLIGELRDGKGRVTGVRLKTTE